MKFTPLDIPDVILVQPEVHRDARGFFLETFHAAKFEAAALPTAFVQDNHSLSAYATLRGLHLQVRKPQGKLIRVIAGEIWDVAVDVRPGSPTFGKWTAVTLSAANFAQLYVPPGCAHGFCVLSAEAQVEYKCTELYDPADEMGIAYNEPALAIPWPVADPLLSTRDQRNGSLEDYLTRLKHEGSPDPSSVGAR